LLLAPAKELVDDGNDSIGWKGGWSSSFGLIEKLLVLLERQVFVGTEVVLRSVEGNVPNAPQRPIPRLRKLLHNGEPPSK